ncbi:ABC transporter substrate-binding protein [Mesorhizobium sp. NPDC059054]|uniref:ABC transporter substrate-binding protein n=1 Tax=Mesorhizobium sp. NPDC059054 TaxID=3346711 RepID=UPI0036904999
MKTALMITTAMVAALAAAPAMANEKFTFALNWFPVGDHAAYWVAKEKGYFAEKGLDVVIENSKGSGDSIAKVDTGRADAGLADAAVVIGSRGRGTTVKVVGVIFDRTPMNFFSKTSAPITKPSDLPGKTVGAPPGDSQRLMWPAFANANGLDPNVIKWVNIEPSAKYVALAEGRADAVSDYTTGLPLAEKAVGKGNAATLNWADYNFQLYAMSIMTSEATIKDRPEALRGFLEAAYKGWQDVMKDPEGAMKIYKKAVPEIDVVALRENMDLGFELMKTKTFKEKGIGAIDKEKMCGSVDLVNTYMGLSTKIDCADAYDDTFLTRIELPFDVQ